MSPQSLDTVAQTLAKPHMHKIWVQRYRSSRNRDFFSNALSSVMQSLKLEATSSVVLDAGCGTATKSVILAEIGYSVTAIDYAETIVESAHVCVQQSAFADKIELKVDDLTALSERDECVDAALCWGTLMHIHDIEAAVAELCRVIRPGGYAVIGEASCRSLQGLATRLFRAIKGRNEHYTFGAYGIELWKPSEAGDLLIRHMDIPKLITLFESHGLKLETRRAGQFTEAYAFSSNPTITMAIHAFNDFWFKYIGFAPAAYGNILVFRKTTH